MKPLAIIPTFLREPGDVKLLRDTVESLHKTAPGELEILVIDDGSPAETLVDSVEASTMGVEVLRKEANTGFSRTVNFGLRRALREGRNAILVNADIEVLSPGWVGVMEQQRGLVNPFSRAAVVGGLLMFPSGLIQHGGIYFSLLTRTFDHYYKYGPWNLPEAMQAATRPVTGALQFIRHECLTNVGLYDESFRMGWEDVDYNLRVLLSGRECVYQPAVRAFHHEGMFRFRKGDKKLQHWERESFMRLMEKYKTTSFAELVPTL